VTKRDPPFAVPRNPNHVEKGDASRAENWPVCKNASVKKKKNWNAGNKSDVVKRCFPTIQKVRRISRKSLEYEENDEGSRGGGRNTLFNSSRGPTTLCAPSSRSERGWEKGLEREKGAKVRQLRYS